MKIPMKFLVLAVLFAGCSKGGGGGGGGGAVAPQGTVNSKISGAASKALTGQAALFNASRNQGNNPSANATLIEAALLNAELASKPKVSESKAAAKAKANSVSKVINSSACKIDPGAMDAPRGKLEGAAEQFKPFHMTVSGEGCPVAIHMKVTMDGVGGADPCQPKGDVKICKFASTMTMTYQVRDEKLANELEVRSGHVKMKFDIEEIVPGDNDGRSGPTKIEFGGGGTGSVDIRAVDLQGKVYLISGSHDENMKVVQSPSNDGPIPTQEIHGILKEEFKYVDEAAGVSSIISANVTINNNNVVGKFLVDGVSVTEEAYRSEVEKFANVMMESGPSQNQGNGGNQPQDGSDEDPDSPNPPAPPNPPVPPSQPNDRKWICVIEDYSNQNVFAGYGPVEFVARSKATQACNDTQPNRCSSFENCEEQSANPNAWFCRTSNDQTGQRFDGSGASQTEASYLARKACFKGSGSATWYCNKVYDSDCVRL